MGQPRHTDGFSNPPFGGVVNTSKYKEQHKDLLAMAGSLQAMLNVQGLSQNADAARKCLGEIAGKLNVHLAMEDQVLYPALLKGASDTSAMAQRFIDEMGGIKAAFGAYLAAWPGAGVIQKDPQGFISQTKGIIEALHKRIRAEENELYPLAERVG